MKQALVGQWRHARPGEHTTSTWWCCTLMEFAQAGLLVNWLDEYLVPVDVEAKVWAAIAVRGYRR